jgi:hypothetical protein
MLELGVSVCRMDDVMMTITPLLMVMMMYEYLFISHGQVQYWSLPGGSARYKTRNERQNK